MPLSPRAPKFKVLISSCSCSLSNPTLKLGTVGGRRTRDMRRRDKTSKSLETVSRLFLPPMDRPTSGVGILASARLREDSCAFAVRRQTSVNRRWPLGACGRRRPAACRRLLAACRLLLAVALPSPTARRWQQLADNWQTTNRQLTDN